VQKNKQTKKIFYLLSMLTIVLLHMFVETMLKIFFSILNTFMVTFSIYKIIIVKLGSEEITKMFFFYFF